jgi:hypothetical protein
MGKARASLAPEFIGVLSAQCDRVGFVGGPSSKNPAVVFILTGALGTFAFIKVDAFPVKQIIAEGVID